MSLRQRDYILRMIEQLAESLAAIAGLREAGQLDDASRRLRETADGILGPMRSMLDSLDASTAASLVGSVEKLRAYADLVDEEGRIRAARGDERGAAADARRAAALRAEAQRIGAR